MKTLCSALALIASTAAADPSPDGRPLASSEQHQWNAVGRVNVGGIGSTGACSGTLVAPDLVITAGHCVGAVLGDTPRRELSDLHFVAGWNRGDYAGHSTAAEVIPHPDYVPGSMTALTVRNDVAFIRLAEPLDVTPMSIGRIQGAETLEFLGYRNGRLHAPEHRGPCGFDLVADGLVTFDCRPVSGNSGAPLFRSGEPGEVVAVISAQTRNGGLAPLTSGWAAETYRALTEDDGTN